MCVTECRGFESHSRQLNFSKKKWDVSSVVELFALHLLCCSSMIHVCVSEKEIEREIGERERKCE